MNVLFSLEERVYLPHYTKSTKILCEDAERSVYQSRYRNQDVIDVLLSGWYY